MFNIPYSDLVIDQSDYTTGTKRKAYTRTATRTTTKSESVLEPRTIMDLKNVQLCKKSQKKARRNRCVLDD